MYDEQDRHPDFARGQRSKERPSFDHPDFARGQGHGESDGHEGDFAEGQGQERHLGARDHGDFARGQRHLDRV
jgi:hypothetical protein